LIKSRKFFQIYREKLIQTVRYFFNEKLINRISKYQSFLFNEVKRERYSRFNIQNSDPHRTNPRIKNETTWINMLNGMKEFVFKRIIHLKKELNINK
jgi:hypothetical protein